MCLTLLGVCALERADADRVSAAFEEVMLMLREPRDITCLGYGLSGMACAAALAARELSNLQIAEELGISERTVSTHMHRILRKLGLHSRIQLAEWMRGQPPSQ